MKALDYASIAKRLKERRQSLGFSYQDLADRTGLSKSTLQRYEVGSIKNIPIARLQELSRALSLDPKTLIGLEPTQEEQAQEEARLRLQSEEEVLRTLAAQYLQRPLGGMSTLQLREQIEPLPPLRQVPLLGAIACGLPRLAQEEDGEQVAIPAWIEADFALRCRGDSMINARLFDGDLVYIRAQSMVENGEIAAVIIEDEATLKRVYYKEGQRLTLRAANPLYDDLEYSAGELNQIQIIGKMIGFTSTRV